MSEVDLSKVAKLYHSNQFARPILDGLAAQPNIGNSPPPYGMNYAVDQVAKTNIPFNRRDIVNVFRELESLGAGKVVSAGVSEFEWAVNPVLLARVATGERDSL